MPTIPPTPSSPVGSTFADGWRAAYIAQGFTDAPIVVTPPVILPPVIVVGTTPIPDGSDLSPLLENAQPKTTLSCIFKGNYRTSRKTIIPATTDNVTLELNHSNLAVNASADSAANIINKSPHFSIQHAAKITGANLFLRNYADWCSVRSCYIESAISNFVWTDGGIGLIVQNCKIGHTGSVSVYLTGDQSWVDNCWFAGAQGEYDIRWEPDSTGHMAVGSKLTKSVLANIAGFNKDTGGPRMIKGLEVSDNVIQGDFRFAQGIGAKTPDDFAPGFIFARNTVFGTRPGINGLSVYGGGRGTVTANRFFLNALSSPAIGVGANSAIVAADNVIVHPAGIIVPQLIGTSSAGGHPETGTIHDTSVAGNVPPDITSARWDATFAV